jgi:hypothetical protein
MEKTEAASNKREEHARHWRVWSLLAVEDSAREILTFFQFG